MAEKFTEQGFWISEISTAMHKEEEINGREVQ